MASRSALLAILIAIGASWSYSAFDFDRSLAAMHERWGQSGVQRLQRWRQLVFGSAMVSELDQLTRVNNFFNRQILFAEDEIVWGQRDYWASPMETLGQGRGDCEDYAIAKLFTLRMLGVEPEKLRLIYVQARIVSAGESHLSAHMILAYYPQADAEPLVMDNLVSDIRPASGRTDLAPVFSFNDNGVYKRPTGSTEVRVGSTKLLSRWESLIRQANAEGFY